MESHLDTLNDIAEHRLKDLDEEYKKAEKLVQQKLKKIKQMNETLDSNKLQGVFPFCYSHIAIGNSRAGKTFALYELLKNDSYKILDRILNGTDIYIISPTAHLDTSMGRIIDLFKNKFKDFGDDQIYTDCESAVQIVTNRMKDQMTQKQAKKEIPYILIIIDDCITEFKMKYFQTFLQKLATQGRHYHINFWVATQSYKQLSPVIRRNITHFSIHNINLQTELETIAQELRNSNITQKEFCNIIQKITGQEGYNYLLVCQLKKNSDKYLVNAQDMILL